MFSKKAIIAVASLVVVASAGPIAAPHEPTDLSARSSFPSFNNYLGFSTLNNFDNFFGIDNFAGVFNVQTIIQQQQIIVCQSLPIEIIQQKLIILQEVAKQIILTQVCEVEVQQIVLQQFSAGFNFFDFDLRHLSGKQAAFDFGVANKFGSIFGSDGSLSTVDLGFNGLDVGKNSVIVGGNNWNDDSSPSSVGQAKALAEAASNITFS